jgi:molecular chaperone HscA
VSSAWSDAAIIGNRAYFASSDTTTTQVGVVAIDTDTGKQIWASDRAGTASQWEAMRPVPDGLALFARTENEAGTDTPVGKRRMAMLSAEYGNLRWQRTLDPEDEVFFAGDTAVVNDRAGRRLVGLKLRDGTERWSLPDPASTSSTAPTVLAVTTPKDLGGPAGVFGRPFDPDFADDPRIVQISADKSARVLNADSGKVLTSRQSVAAPGDEVVAHNGRLIVHQPDGQRIVSYQLDRLGEPDVLYTAQAQNAQLKNLTPCGDDRVCFDETIGYDKATTAVVALDVARGDEVWRYPLANVERLVPVGEAVLATNTSTAAVTLIGADGKQVWALAGEAVRLDGGNLMHFSKPLSKSPSDPAIAGQHLGDDVEPLGAFRDIRSDTCSWNTTLLACVADKDFVLIEFAD